MHKLPAFFILLITLLPLYLPSALMAYSAKPGVLHLSYIVEAYDPETKRPGLFEFYSPKLLTKLNLGKEATELLHKPFWGFFAKHVVINMSIDYSNDMVNFTIIIGPGFIAKLKPIRFVTASPSTYVIAKVGNISYRGIVAIIKRSYRFDPRTYTLFDPEGKWEGTSLYLAPVDPSKPVFHVFYLSPIPSTCFFHYSDYTRSLLTRLARSVGINLTLIKLGPGQSITIQFGDNSSTTVGGGRTPILVVKECSESSIYGVIIDPRAEAKPYASGGVVVPADEAVYFGSELVSKNIDVLRNEIGTGVTRVNDFVAMAIGNTSSGYGPDLFMAINSRALPANILKYMSLMLREKPEGIILHTNIIYSSTISSIRGEYHLSGYLLWAETGFVDIAVSMIAPALDVAPYFKWGGRIYYQLINASVVRTSLVAISGSKSLPAMAAFPQSSSALFYAVWASILLFSLSALFASRWYRGTIHRGVSRHG